MESLEKSLKYLRCPISKNELELAGDQLKCGADVLPILGRVPVLSKYPDSFLAQWQGRAFAVLNFLEKRAGEAEREAKISHLYESTRERLEQMQQGLKKNSLALQELLAPMDLYLKNVEEVRTATVERISAKVTLDGYYNNIFRDWAWDNGENEKSLAILDKTLGENKALGVAVHLGPGAGRLAADIHKSLKPGLSIAIDFNPLLALTADRMAHGEDLTLFEFPEPAIDKSSACVEHNCKSPYGALDNFCTVIADAMTPPIKDKSVDTVITSWFIDIIPQPLGQTCKQINRILKEGGRWINFGPLGFSGSPAQCFSKEEVKEIVEKNLFSVSGWNFEQVPYLQSPSSCHGRIEKVLCFVAEKTKSVDEPSEYETWPEWITDFSQPIPVLPQFLELKVKSNVYYDILDAINGERSVNEITQLMMKVYKMDETVAKESLLMFLSNIWDGKIQA